jgi:hypothetical protein
MATKKPMKKFKRYDEGGDVSEARAKQRGLDISNKEEPVGFFERIRAGDIDQPGTEAYNRFGAGRGYAKNMDDENEAMREAMRSPSKPAASAASSRDLSDEMYSDYGSSTGAGAAGTSETVKPTRQVMNKPKLPAKPTAPDKQSTGFYMPPESRDKPNYSNEGRTKPAPAGSAASQIPGGSKTPAPQGEKINSSETSRNLENAATALGVGAGAAGLYKLGRKLFSGGKKAAEKVSPYLKELTMDKKKLTGPNTPSKSSDVTDVVPKKTSYRSETNPKKREDGKANEAYDRLMKLTRKKDDGMKRGGSVQKYASGGSVSSESRRADGIASKGKTRGKIC